MKIAVPPPEARETDVQDFDRLIFNYLNGKLDISLEFNSDRIIMNEYSPTGSKPQFYDPGSGQHLDAGPQVVCDELGNPIVIGAGPMSGL